MSNFKKRLIDIEKTMDSWKPKKEPFEEYGLKDRHEYDIVLVTFMDTLETFYGMDFDEIPRERANNSFTDEEDALFNAILEQFKAGKLLEENGRYQLNPEFTNLKLIKE